MIFQSLYSIISEAIKSITTILNGSQNGHVNFTPRLSG